MPVNNNRATKPLIVYIASASRSGSTLLDMNLGNLPGIMSVGELRRIREFTTGDRKHANVRDIDNPVTCTCGRPVLECQFWRQVEQISKLSLADTPLSSQASSYWRRILQITYFLFGAGTVKLVARFFPKIANELSVGRNCFAVYDAINELTGSIVIIDSSKMLYHYLLLKIYKPDRVKLIFLVRDGRAVAKSMIKKQRKYCLTGKKGDYYEQAVRVWRKVNWLLLIFFKRTPQNERFFIKYEDFCAENEKKINDIIREFRLPTVLKKIRPKTFKYYHNIGGSPSRFGFGENWIVADEKWRESMTQEEEKIFYRLGGRLSRYLGYILNS